MLQHLLRSHNPTTDSITQLNSLRRTLSYTTNSTEIHDCIRRSLLTTVTSLGVRRVYLVIDGIDALDAQRQCYVMQRLEFLRGIFYNSNCALKVTVMSRPLCFLRLFREVSTMSRFELTADHTRPDLRLYIQSSLDLLALKGISCAGLEDQMTSIILQRSNNYFPLAQGILEDLELVGMNTESPDMKTVLFDRIPDRSRKLFQQQKEKIQESSQSYKACQILVAAMSSITVQDLDALLWAASTDSRLRGMPPSYNSKAARPYEYFVGISANNIQIFNPVLEKYLLSENFLKMKECHALMALACLNIAALQSLSKAGPVEKNLDDGVLLPQFKSIPGLKYAIRHWSHHFMSSNCFDVAKHYLSHIGDRLGTAKYLVSMEGDVADSMIHTRSSEKFLSLNLEARITLIGSSHPDTITTRMQVAQNAQCRGEVALSQHHYLLICNSPDFNKFKHDDRYRILSGIARSFERQNCWSDAEVNYLHCLDLCSSVESLWMQRRIESQNSLAWVLQAQGRTENAIQACEIACRLAHENLGPGHTESRLAIQNIATMYERTGKTVQARLILLNHLDRCDCEYGPGHHSTVDALRDLVSFLERQNDGEQSQSVCRQLMERCRSQGMSMHEIGQLLADLYEAHGQYCEAEVTLKGLCTGSDAQAVVLARSTLSKFYVRRGSWFEAGVLLQACLDSHETNLTWRARSEIIILMAECKQRMGLSSKAQDKINEFLRLRDRNCDWTCREDINSSNDLGAYYERHQRWADALGTYTYIHEHIKSMFGPKHKYSISTEQTLAAYAERTYNWKEAERLYGGIGKALVETRGTRHWLTMTMWKKHLLTKLHELRV